MPSTLSLGEKHLHIASPLPLNDSENVDEYVQNLLSFITSSDLFQKLCGGVHILDFLTNEPDLYTTILPEEWRDWFENHEVPKILDLLMRETSHEIEFMRSVLSHDSFDQYGSGRTVWRERPLPPLSLLDYIHCIRKYALDRSFTSDGGRQNKKSAPKVTLLPRHVAVGMKPKKVHEVQNFAKYINELVANVHLSSTHQMNHIVDFGSGQNYLGRALASPPYNQRVVALESKVLNISGAKDMDITAKLAEKEKIMRNKKEYRHGLPENAHRTPVVDLPKSRSSTMIGPSSFNHVGQSSKDDGESPESGRIQYIETFIENGDLSRVIDQIEYTAAPQLMVVSLHSCGNLLHHGLRSLILNPNVKAVALVGCCYNLVTERLGPPTYKLPSLRSCNRRLDQTSSAYDPHGFPMSEKFVSYQHCRGNGIRLNITARMMAVQAPENWTATDCESFFTRHFYRALLQRILVDHKLVDGPSDSGTGEASPRDWSETGPPLTVGSLRKACYASFVAYVRGATAKLAEDPRHGTEISRVMKQLTDQDIRSYEERFQAKKKELSIIWSLMAFSASVVESAIVVDRWLFLKEQEEVKDCWVETVFDYKQSPRNLVVVGIKK